MAIIVPPWLALVIFSAEYWPIVVALAAMGAIGVYFLRGVWRWLALVLVALAVIGLAFIADFGLLKPDRHDQSDASERSVTTTAAGAIAIDGLEFPAGTEIVWTDPTRRHFDQAALPHPAALFGVQVDRIQREVDGLWALHLVGPQTLDGWSCQPDLVEVEADGRLHRCELASGRDWNGWPIPPATLVSPGSETVAFVFPPEASIPSSEIGRPLPLTGAMTINRDGSLDTVYFEPDAPLEICGTTLWNTVQWRYDPATLGQGRGRGAIGVSGATPTGEAVALSLPTCTQ